MSNLEIIQEAAMGMRSGTDWFALDVHGSRLAVFHTCTGWHVGDLVTGRCFTFRTFAAACDSICEGRLP